MYKFIYLSTLLIMFSSCTNNLTEKQTLPYELREVSGITAISDKLVAMVQDEEGIIYLYDISKAQVLKKLCFSDAGDYEDIEYLNEKYYVLHSNGTIDIVDESGTLIGQIEAAHLSIKNDTEGLCYSPTHNSLLVMCKEKGGDQLGKHEKAIYSVDLETGQYSEEPIIIIDRSVFLEKKKRKKFKPAGILVNNDNQLIVIDSKSSLLANFSINGEYINHTKLDLPQPEGICLMPNGDIWIVSEGEKNGFFSLLKK